MPWKETVPMNELVQFIAAAQRKEVSFAELCRQFGISRKTGYKWQDRFAAEGTSGLHEHSRAPLTHPQAMAPSVEATLLALRSANPLWGARKLVAHLARTQPETVWPAASTVGDLLRRQGLAVPRKVRRRASPTLSHLEHGSGPNEVWCADFKGQFRTGDGAWCYPLTITDEYSRFLLRCQSVTVTGTDQVRPLFEAAFREYGLPQRLRTDNGPPFASTGLGGLSRLSVWWIRLGIVPERIRPGKPEDNGRHERMHRTLNEATAQPPEANVRAQQRTFDQFRQEFNEVRPHEALGQRPPGLVYGASEKRYPVRLEELGYPGSDRVLQVRTSGELYLHKQYVHLTKALAGERVGLYGAGDRQWEVRFGPVILGVLDERRGKVRQLRRTEPEPEPEDAAIVG